MIVCVLFPHFAAAVAEQQDPALAGKALVIGGYPWQRKKVYAASFQARRAGIEPGITLSKAWLLSPDANFIPADETLYQTAFEEIVAALQEFTHRIEPEAEVQTAPACYLDLGSLHDEHLHQISVQIMTALAPFRPAISIASNKFTARAAAALGEQGTICFVPQGEEGAFLSGIPLNRLRLSQNLARKFRLLGIRTLGDLGSLPGPSILTQFGEEGIRLYHLAHGRDDRPLKPRLPEASIHAERQFDAPIQNLLILDNLLQDIAQEIAGSLAEDALACRNLTLRIAFDDFTSGETFLDLRDPLTRCDLIHMQLTAMRERLPITKDVTALLVMARGLETAIPRQLPLFPEFVTDKRRFDDILPLLQTRHQGICIFRVMLTGDPSPLPERAYQFERISAA